MKVRELLAKAPIKKHPQENKKAKLRFAEKTGFVSLRRYVVANAAIPPYRLLLLVKLSPVKVRESITMAPIKKHPLWVLFYWCPGKDSNFHDLGSHAPEACASTNSATRATTILLAYILFKCNKKLFIVPLELCFSVIIYWLCNKE